MNEDSLIATVAVRDATGEDKFTNNFSKQNEFLPFLHQNSPEEPFSSIKHEQFVVPDDFTDIKESEMSQESITDYGKQMGVENMEIKIAPNDFPLVEVEEEPTSYDYVAIDDDECVDPLRDTGEPEVKIRPDNNIHACTQCGDLYTATNKFHCPPSQELPLMRQFKCSYCHRVFPREDLLEDHMFTHSSKRYVCDRCGKFFTRRDDFIAHEQSHISNVKCVQCRKLFEDRSTYESHLQKRTVLYCPHCDLHFFMECALNCHLLLHSRENEIKMSSVRRFECDRCNETFASVLSLREHYQVHSAAKPFKCEYCLFLFANSNGLKRHVKKNTCPEVPGKPTKSSCVRCGETFIARCVLLIHELEVHGISRMISIIPNKQLRTANTTILPVSKSANAREEANQSSQVTVRKRNQNIVYTEELQNADTFEDYRCKWCGQQFSTKDCRNQHERIVHRRNVRNDEDFEDFSTVVRDLSYAVLTEQLKNLPKPYKCPWCARLNDSRVGFLEHYLTHTKEKPFVCDICGAGFIRLCQLRQHRASHASVRKNVEANTRTIGETNTKIVEIDTKNLSQVNSKSFFKTYVKKAADMKGVLKTYTKSFVNIDVKNVAETNSKYMTKTDTRNLKEVPVPRKESTRPAIDSSCKVFNDGDMVLPRETEFNREAIVRLTKLDPSLVQDTVFVCSICYKFFALPVSLLGHRKTCIHKYRLRLLEQTGKAVPSIKENQVLRKTHSSNNHVFVDRFGIQHSIIFEGDRRFFKCGRCVRRFGRKDRLVRHSETHYVADNRQVRPKIGPLARKSTMYRLNVPTYSKPSNVNVLAGLKALGDLFHGSRIPEGLDITICENETAPRTIYSSLKSEEMDQYMEADSDFDSDDISLFEPQCIVKDDDSDTDENVDFYSNDNGSSESSAHHFLEIEMSQSDYNSSIGESDYNSGMDIGSYTTSAVEIDYDSKSELNRCQNTGNGGSDYSLVENVVTHEDDNWVCAQCNSFFARKYDLIQHYNVHKDEISFKCVYCDKEFTKRKYLTRHARRHIKKMKYSCSECNEFFDALAELEKHNCRHPVPVVVSSLNA